MEVWIDADGCPVTKLAVKLARQAGIPCTVVCDTAHEFRDVEAKVLTVSKGADSVDFALVNRLHAGDIVVTQDYGLAAMCLSRDAKAIHHDGFLYNETNMDGLLFFRAAAGKIRKAGGRLKGPSRRTKEQDDAFSAAFFRLLQEVMP